MVTLLFIQIRQGFFFLFTFVDSLTTNGTSKRTKIKQAFHQIPTSLYVRSSSSSCLLRFVALPYRSDSTALVWTDFYFDLHLCSNKNKKKFISKFTWTRFWLRGFLLCPTTSAFLFWSNIQNIFWLGCDFSALFPASNFTFLIPLARLMFIR